ncbi:MAG: ACP S-malonyltransferase [Puniceicoccales bacterium]|jgi:[acyl-carrier-protein] S-malonyltransferase|nr:ACP S-malonyltransferase [Puniceicoccales bacterium]
MKKVAFIFPGQGTQTIGMGRPLYEHVPKSRKYFDEANEILDYDFTKIIWEGPEEVLMEGRHCQPALYVHQFVLAMLKKEMLTTDGSQVGITFGLSLGELTALALADVYDFATGLQLASTRGQLMQEASRQNPGGMLALLGGSLDEIHELCSRTGVEMANFNTPSQIVVAGTITQIQEAEILAQSLSFSRVVPLKVAGASHCSLMKEARDVFHDYLKDVTFREPRIPVIQNVNAEVVTDPEVMKKNLEAQLVSSVLWCQSIQKAAALGFEKFYECGVGRTLKGMAKQIDHRLQVFSVQDTEFIPVAS